MAGSHGTAPDDGYDGEEEGEDLLDDLHTQALFGPLRGEPPLDREATVDLLVALGSMATNPEVISVDLNPLIVSDGRPIAVDALVELAEGRS